MVAPDAPASVPAAPDEPRYSGTCTHRISICVAESLRTANTYIGKPVNPTRVLQQELPSFGKQEGIDTFETWW